MIKSGTLNYQKFPGVVQWLGFCTFTAEGPGSPLVKELILKPCGVDKKTEKNVTKMALKVP